MRKSSKIYLTTAALVMSCAASENQSEDGMGKHYPKMAAQIVTSLQPSQGEQALVRYDPQLMAGLEQTVKRDLEKAGVQVELLEYGPAPDFESKLEWSDIYIWLPTGADVVQPAEQRQKLHDWLVQGRGRQIHFHWGDGTRSLDGLNATHNAAYDSVYLAALEIDYAQLTRQQRSAVRLLKAGEIHVTTPAGSDLRFKVGDRPFTIQNGDASKATTSAAGAIIGREIELPAGVVRVAPLEESVSGKMVLPSAQFEGQEVRDLKLEFEQGKIVRFSASQGEAAFRAALSNSPGLNYFRELGLGFNPKLRVPDGETAIPYYGYGEGIVRLSLGNNEELGGSVTRSGIRWLLFDDATIIADGTVILDKGELKLPTS